MHSTEDDIFFVCLCQNEVIFGLDSRLVSCMTTQRAIGGTGILIKALVSLTISRIGDKCRWGKNTRVHDLFQFDCVNSDCTGDADSHADLIGLQ